MYGDKERLAESKEVIVKPQEQYPVHVLFAPSRTTNREAQLVIRVVNSTTKHTVSSRLEASGCLGQIHV